MQRDLTPAQQDVRRHLGAGANTAAGSALVAERIAIAASSRDLIAPAADPAQREFDQIGAKEVARAA